MSCHPLSYSSYTPNQWTWFRTWIFQCLSFSQHYSGHDNKEAS